jgi:hypothetical protein
VAGRDVVGIVGTELHLGPILADDVDTSRDDHPHVAGAAPLAPDLGSHMLRPSPSRLGDEPTDREIAKLHHPLRGAREGDRLFRCPKALSYRTGHDRMMAQLFNVVNVSLPVPAPTRAQAPGPAVGVLLPEHDGATNVSRGY